MASKWTAVKYNAKKDIVALTGALERVKLSKDMWIEVVVDLDDALEKAFKADGSWCDKLQDTAMKSAKGKLSELAKRIKEIDAEAEGLGAENCKRLESELEATTDKLFDAAGEEMTKVAHKMMADYQKANRELDKYHAKARTKLAIEVATVGAEGVVLFPIPVVGQALALVALIRGAIAIFEEVVKLFGSADGIAGMIQTDLKNLQIWMHDDGPRGAEAQWKLKGDGKRSVMEVGLNVLGKLLGTSAIPSLKNLEANIAIHSTKITQMQAKSKDFGAEINKAISEQERCAKQVKQFLLVDHRTSFAKGQLKDAEKALDKVLTATVSLNEAITKAEQRHATFQAALDEMNKGLHSSVKYINAALAVASNLADGAAAAEGLLETAMGAASDVAQAAADEAEASKQKR